MTNEELKTLTQLADEGLYWWNAMMTALQANDTYHDMTDQIYEANAKWLEINRAIRDGRYKKE
jgi:hypothetical protein